MREKMLVTAEWIDELRGLFGAEAITQAMREGLRDGSFWAIEGGQVVGKVSPHMLERWGMAPPGFMGPPPVDDPSRSFLEPR